MKRYPHLTALLLALTLLATPLLAKDGTAAPEPTAENSATEGAAAVENSTAAPEPTRKPMPKPAIPATDGDEVLRLQAGESAFQALFREERRGEPEGALLLIHDIAAHPDWPGVIAPLRRQMPERGWATLSLQAPLSDGRSQDELLSASRLRISAALEALRQRNQHNIVIVGHGFGALLAADFLAENLASGVSGAVLVGMPSLRDGQEPPLDAATLIGKLNLPVLDIYGSRDLPQVVSEARQRYSAANRQEQGLTSQEFRRGERLHLFGQDQARRITYRQIMITGADHTFTSQESSLVRRVGGWLKRHVPGRALPIGGSQL